MADRLRNYDLLSKLMMSLQKPLHEAEDGSYAMFDRLLKVNSLTQKLATKGILPIVRMRLLHMVLGLWSAVDDHRVTHYKLQAVKQWLTLRSNSTSSFDLRQWKQSRDMADLAQQSLDYLFNTIQRNLELIQRETSKFFSCDQERVHAAALEIDIVLRNSKDDVWDEIDWTLTYVNQLVWAFGRMAWKPPTTTTRHPPTTTPATTSTATPTPTGP